MHMGAQAHQPRCLVQCSATCAEADALLCRYAWECQTQEGGWGLDGVLREQSWKLRGIVNGIDTSDWSPQQDSYLRSEGYTNYDMDSLVEGKARCKAALQRVRPASCKLLIITCLPAPCCPQPP